MEVQDPELLKIQKKAATDLYKENVNSDSDNEVSNSKGKDQKVIEFVNDTIRYYHEQVKKDSAHVRKSMIVEAERIRLKAIHGNGVFVVFPLLCRKVGLINIDF